MLKKIVGSAILVSAFFFVGCTPNPQVEDYNFKQAPTVNKYKSAIKEKTALLLEKPQDAIHVVYGTPFKGYMLDGSIPNNVRWTGWVIPIDVSVKDSSGKHRGLLPYGAAIMDEDVFVAKRYRHISGWIAEIYAFDK